MDTHINRDDYIPYYIQVKNSIKDHIESGGLKVGDQLPGEPELCEKFHVSRTVIRQALKELEIEGLVRREKGRGTFVSERKYDYRAVQKLTGFFQDTVERGLEPVTKILEQELIPAPDEVAHHLQLEAGTDVIKIHRLRGIDNEYSIIDTTYLPYEVCPQVLEANFTSQSLYAFLEDELGLSLTSAHRTIEAVGANEYVASKLEIDEGEPVLLFESVAYLEDGTPVEYFRGHHCSRRTMFSVDLIRIKD